MRAGRAHRRSPAYPYLEKNTDLRTARRLPVPRRLRASGGRSGKFGDLGDQGQRAAVGALNSRGRRAGDLRRRGQGRTSPATSPTAACAAATTTGGSTSSTRFTPMEWYHYNPTGPRRARQACSPSGREIMPGRPRPRSAGGAVDIAFVVDTTGLDGRLDRVRQGRRRSAWSNDVSARTSAARFALVDYRDFPDRTGDAGDYPAKLDLDFTSDAATVDAAIQGLALGDGGDRPETMFSGIMTARSISPGGRASRSWRSCSPTRRRSRPRAGAPAYTADYLVSARCRSIRSRSTS